MASLHLNDPGLQRALCAAGHRDRYHHRQGCPVNEATSRTVNLRVPTAMTASDVVAGVYASLASLRGWLITGNDAFKVERATLWKEMQSNGAKMDAISGQWTLEQNKTDWKQAKGLLDELRSAQDKAEAIAHTIDEQPAAKLLSTEAAPLAKLMLQKATAIIDEDCDPRDHVDDQ
jgi:methyl-accepting chemotaxis protein